MCPKFFRKMTFWCLCARVLSKMGVVVMLLMIKDVQCLTPCTSGVEVLLSFSKGGVRLLMTMHF